jgi:glycyl-tRNA synthetase beta chain
MSLSSMMDMRNLLVELFVEELPPKALKKLGESFSAALLDGLRTQGLAGEQSAATAYATPRRLAAHVSRVLEQAADRSVVHKLMPAAVGLDAAGQPTPALKKKLAALGADDAAVARIERRADGKAETLFLPAVVPGARLADGLQTALDAAIAQLPIPKTMTYQLDDGWTSVQFVRPLHGLVALHGADVVPVRALGHDAGRQTRGHRFEASMEPVVLQDADHYAQQLEAQGAVIAGFAQRRGEVARQLQRVAAEQGLTPIADDALLDEVTALVERPNVLLCRFDPAFLAVPAECLILTMKANQKYFPLLDGEGRLTDRFLVVSNIRPDDAGAVITGNQRVVRPRLADAKFFFDQDRKQSLESRLPRLDKVVYHAKLGSLGERVQRVRTIARAIGEQIGGPALAQQADRAAQLAKADLLTDMVGEFPELQGVMGGYYARHDGESEAVALAVEDHYKPRFAGDDLPRNEVGLVVALADKLETLVGLFGIGEKPTGDKDPFALRRHALGVIRMLVERGLPLRLDLLLNLGEQAFKPGSIGEAQGDIASFVFERFAGQLREQGYTSGEVDAVLSMRPVQLHLVPRQLEAVRAFAAMQEAPALASANKRVGNILKKADAVLSAVQPALFAEEAERALQTALDVVRPRADAAFDSGDYTASLRELAALKAPVDAFFDSVMVNADDPALRANRLALLAQLQASMNRVADLSRLSN